MGLEGGQRGLRSSWRGFGEGVGAWRRLDGDWKGDGREVRWRVRGGNREKLRGLRRGLE